MSEKGYIFLSRGALEHEFFRRQEYSEFEAWVWLLTEAAWKPRSRRLGEFVVDLERGQLVASVRHMAEVWTWSKGKVERYMGRLKTETMVRTHTETGITIITICNYGKYQKTQEQNGTATNQEPGRARDTDGDNTEEIKNLKKETDGASAPPNIVSLTPSPEKLFFDQAVQILGPDGRSLAAKLLKAKNKNVMAAHAVLLTAAQKSDPRQYLGAVIRGDTEEDKRRRWAF